MIADKKAGKELIGDQSLDTGLFFPPFGLYICLTLSFLVCCKFTSYFSVREGGRSWSGRHDCLCIKFVVENLATFV